MAKSKIKFGLIGYGNIGRKHAATIGRHPGCELVSIIDSNKEVGQETNGIPYYTTVQNYLSTTPEVDAFVIATPNGTHASLALELLDAGKHVLVEKPFALTKKEAEEIINKANERSKQVMVVLQNRFSPVSQWLKKITGSGVLGQVFFLEINCFWNRNQHYYSKDSWHGTMDMDGGILYTQFSHFIDTIYWIFGDITRIGSRFYNYRHHNPAPFADTGSVIFEFCRGGAGCFNFTTAAWEKNMESSITVLAEFGSIKISGQYMDKVEYCHIKDYNFPGLSANDPAGNNLRMLDEFVKAIEQNKGSNSLDGLHSVDLIERMYGSGS